MNPNKKNQREKIPAHRAVGWIPVGGTATGSTVGKNKPRDGCQSPQKSPGVLCTQWVRQHSTLHPNGRPGRTAITRRCHSKPLVRHQSQHTHSCVPSTSRRDMTPTAQPLPLGMPSQLIPAHGARHTRIQINTQQSSWLNCITPNTCSAAPAAIPHNKHFTTSKTAANSLSHSWKLHSTYSSCLHMAAPAMCTHKQTLQQCHSGPSLHPRAAPL